MISNFIEKNNIIILKTYLYEIFIRFYTSFDNIFNDSIKNLAVGIISLLIGFFMSTTLSTIPGQTGDWSIVGASIIVAFTEIISKNVYYFHNNKNFEKSKNNRRLSMIQIINSLKIGIVYGLIC